MPVFAEHLQVRANRVDARFVDRENREEMLREMSCPWMDNREQNEQEKTGEDSIQGTRFDSSTSLLMLLVATQGV